MNKLLTDRVKLIRALQGCVKLHFLYFKDENTLKDAIRRIRDDHKSFLSLSQDKDGRVSYSGKPGDRLNSKRRIRTSLGRYFRRQLKIGYGNTYGDGGIIDKNMAWIQAQVFACTADIDGSITVVQGKDIREAYNTGFGGYTCMSGGDYSGYTKLYADNPGVVAMIKYENGVQARALLWTTDDGAKVLDRVYPDDGGAHIIAIRLWAEKQGYIARSYNHLPEDDSIPLSDDSERKVKLHDSKVYPYLDTFCFGTIKRGHVHLSNVKKDGDHIFQGTNGEWLEDFKCCSCGDNIREDEVHSHGGEDYCEDCFSKRFALCSWCEEYYDPDSMVHCSENGNTYCEGCADEELSQCCHCNEWHRNENVIKAADTGNEYCKECAADKLTPCEECGDFYEEPMEEIKDCLYCPECAANLKQKDLFKNRRKSRKAAVAV